jgi:hypothetical protein
MLWSIKTVNILIRDFIFKFWNENK